MLEALLAPLSADEFFRDFWTKKFLHIPGPPGKFSELFSWEVLSRSLEQHRFEDRRLGLVRAGEAIPGERYIRGKSVNAAGLVRELASGATLFLNQCEEMHRPLRDLCEHLALLFHHRVHANLYAGWRRDYGFEIHWDDHDVLIFQVSGRKHWKVWEPTRRFPFKQDFGDTTTPPATEPIWDGILEPGSLLNIPRGWWHVAFPLDEPCMHLTVSVPNNNGIDLLHWLANSMKASEAARMELPIMSSTEDRETWLARVRADLITAFDNHLLSRFLAEKDSRISPRPVLDLPGDVTRHAKRKQPPLERSSLLELVFSDPVQIRIKEGKTFCQVRSEQFAVDPEVAESLCGFNDRRPHSLAELAPKPNPKLNFTVGMMLTKGLLRHYIRNE